MNIQINSANNSQAIQQAQASYSTPSGDIQIPDIEEGPPAARQSQQDTVELSSASSDLESESAQFLDTAQKPQQAITGSLVDLQG